MSAHDAPDLRDCFPQQCHPDGDDISNSSCSVVIETGMMAAMRVSAIDWPSGLFVDARTDDFEGIGGNTHAEIAP